MSEPYQAIWRLGGGGYTVDDQLQLLLFKYHPVPLLGFMLEDYVQPGPWISQQLRTERGPVQLKDQDLAPARVSFLPSCCLTGPCTLPVAKSCTHRGDWLSAGVGLCWIEEAGQTSERGESSIPAGICHISMNSECSECYSMQRRHCDLYPLPPPPPPPFPH